jgi:hypothetical protein
MVQGIPFGVKLLYVPDRERPLFAPAVRAALSPEKLPHVRTVLALRSPKMPPLIPLRHSVSFHWRTGGQAISKPCCMCLSSSDSLNRHCRLLPVPRGCAGKVPERAMRTIFKRFVFRKAAASSGLTYGSRAFQFMFMILKTSKCLRHARFMRPA